MLSKRSFVRRSAFLAAALLASAVVSAVQAADPAVLSLVPGDAYGVIVINNMRTLANKASNAATRLNLPLPTPDLVGFATRNLGITKGFDANNSAALVLLKPSAEKLAEGYFNGNPPAVILLPTTDAKGMMEPFSPGTPDSKGISQVTLPSNPDEKGYVAVIDDKWIVFAQNRDDILAYMVKVDSFAKTATAETLKVFEKNDVVVWANVEKLGAGMDKILDDRKTDLLGQLDLMNNVATPKPDAMAVALQKQMVGGAINFAKEYLKDSTASMLTVRLTDSGATLGMVGDFKQDSDIGKFVMSQAKGTPLTLKGLPGGNFLAAGAMRWDSASLNKMVSDFTAQLMNDPDIAKSEHAADITKAIDLAKQMMGLTHGMEMVFLDPPAGGKTGLFNGAALVDTSDPKKYMDLEMEALKSGLGQAMNPNVKQAITVEPKPMTVDGVALTQVNMKMEMVVPAGANALEQQIQAAAEQALQRIYGPDGITMYMGTVGTKFLLIYGSDTGTINSAVAAAKGNTEALATNPGIVATKDQVVPNPVAFMYLPITRWVTLAGAMFSPGAPAQGPAAAVIANAPPVVVSAGVNGKLMTAEIHVPIATILGVQEAVKKLEASMNGGGDAGPAPLP